MEPMTQLHEPVQARMPNHVELRVYCPESELTAAAIEQRILPLAESAIGEPLRHSMRRAFPAPLKASVAEEVEASWKSKSGVLLLSNKLSSPNHAMFNARISVRRGPTGALERFGTLSLHVHEHAPRLVDALQRLGDFARMTRAHFGRADSPAWLGATPVFLPLSATWRMKERFGWLNYLPPSCAAQLREADASMRIEALDDGGHLLSLESEQACARASAWFAA
jgi:hypothetical protein